MTAALIEQLPHLKLIASTGPRNAAIDLVAAGKHNVDVVHTGYSSTPTIEFTWAMNRFPPIIPFVGLGMYWQPHTLVSF